MTAKHTTAMTKTGGCGCQSGTAPATPTCSCGGCGCALCEGQGFVRPNFFAGQLLTEEDLDLLTTYVTGKNRLHNRAFFGEGVVCGLEVMCHPCGGGHVIVHPGYALDCCGNDIVVPCPKELDILAMVRKLRIDSLGGYDCGDPCAETNGGGTKTPPKEAAKPAGQVDEFAGTDKKPPEKAPDFREYCLYVRYCEEETDPVTAYTTDEACGAQTCEPTRVREGFRFELRCPSPETEPHDIFWRIRRCFGELGELVRTARDTRTIDYSAAQVHHAVTAIRKQPDVLFTKDHAARLQNGVQQLRTWAQPPTPSETAVPPPEKIGAAQPAEKIVERVGMETLAQRIENTTEVAGLLTRFALAEKPDEEALTATLETYGSSVKLLATARPMLSREIGRMDEGLEKTWANSAMVLVSKTPANPNEPNRAPEMRLLAEGAVYNRTLHEAYVTRLVEFRQRMLDKLDQTPDLTDCKLRDDVKRLLPPSSGAGDITIGEADQFAKSGWGLVGVYLRFLADCLCRALNPPCQPCDDMGVLLACLRVQECEVIDICNLDRTFVLSPVAFRYWLPPLHMIGELFEKLCCESDCRTGRLGYGRDTILRNLSSGPTGEAKTGASAAAVIASPASRLVPFASSLYGPTRYTAQDLELAVHAIRKLGDIALTRVGAATARPSLEAGPLRSIELGSMGFAGAAVTSASERVADRVKELERRIERLERSPGRKRRGGEPEE